MTNSTPQKKLPSTLHLIRTATAQPNANHQHLWRAAKEELASSLEDLRLREERHRDAKLETLKKWEAKAGMLEKKRMAGLSSSADEHDLMHAAGVPGHIMARFREEDAAFVVERRFLQERVGELEALGLVTSGEEEGSL